jgi:predicted DNA-binding protein (UPF0251 family)
MPRRRRLRRVVEPPGFKGYRPYGVAGGSSGKVTLFYEEYEAIKLIDYDRMNHLEASKLMGVSRPTMARVYKSAREKIARSLVERKEIVTSFGHATFDKNWYACYSCNARFTLPAIRENRECAMCGSENIDTIDNQL